MTNEKLNNVIALVVSLAGLLFAGISLYIAFLAHNTQVASLNEQIRATNLNELQAVINMSEDKRQQYLTAKNN